MPFPATISGAHLMDGCQTLDEAADRLVAYANQLRDMQDEGFRLKSPIAEDAGQVIPPLPR